MKGILRIVVLSFVANVVFGKLVVQRGACQVREFGIGEKACVCNATFCDAIRPLSHFPSRIFNMYTSDKKGCRFAATRKNFAAWINPKGTGVVLEGSVEGKSGRKRPRKKWLRIKGCIKTVESPMSTSPSAAKIIVNSSATFQTILGFGGSLSDSTVLNIHSLSHGAQQKLIASYFSEEGIEYNLVKIPIGSTDYSNRSYTLAEVPGDVGLDHFRLSPEDLQFKIPDLLKIKKQSRRSLHLVGTAWSAPPWMKTNNDYVGVGVLKDEYFETWSRYHLRFLEQYNKHGLDFWALTTGHQPSSGLIPFYPYNCMGWTPFSQSQWVADHLGPDLRRSPYNKTKIVALDDVKFFLPWWTKLMFSSPKTKTYVSGIGVQWYWDFVLPSRLLDITRAEFPDKFILGTEASFNKWKGFSTPVVLGSWSRAEEYAESMIDDLNHWVSGWMDSNLALNLKGGPSWTGNFADAALIVNSTADEFYKQPMFYAIGHFSKFISKGSRRISVKVSAPGIKAVGFRTPEGNVVIVLLNKKTHNVPVSILGAKKGNANITLPKKSIMTVIYRDKKKLPKFKVSF